MTGGEVQRAAPDATAGSCAPEMLQDVTTQDAASPEVFDSAGQPVSEMPPDDGFELVDPERETRQIDSPRRDWAGLDKTLFTEAVTVKDYLAERTKLLDKDSKKAIELLMDRNVDPDNAIAKEKGKKGAPIFEKGYLDAMYNTSVGQAVEVEMYAAALLDAKAAHEALPTIVEHGLKTEEVKGRAERLAEFVQKAVSRESLSKLAAAVDRAMGGNLRAKLKDAGKMTAKGGVTWGAAELAVGAIGVENPTLKFAGVIYLMHGQGVAIDKVFRARAAAKAGGTNFGAELAKELSKLAPGATAAEKAASLGKSAVKAPVEALKGMGSGLLASKLAGLVAKGLGADDTTAGCVSTLAFFSPHPLGTVFGNTRAAAFVSRTPLPRVARGAGQAMVAGLADELIYNALATVLPGDDSDYFLAVSMENAKMMGDDYWASLSNISNLPWYEMPVAATAAVDIGALMLVSDLLVPGLTAGVMKKVCDWTDTGFTKSIEARYMAEGKQKSREMGEDLKRLVVHGMGYENESPEFYQEVNFDFMGKVIDPLKNELVEEKEEMSFNFEFDKKNKEKLATLSEDDRQEKIDDHLLSKMGEEKFRQASSIESAARMQEELKFLHMIGYDGGEGASTREIVDEHGRVLDADALLTTYVTPQLVEDEGKEPAFAEMVKKAEAGLAENKAIRAEAHKAAVDSDYEDGGDSYYYDAGDAKPLILAVRKRELVIRALQTPASKKKDELMKLAADVGLCDASGEFVRTPVYYSAVEIFVEDAYARNVDPLKDVANAHYKEIKTRSYNAGGEKEKRELETEMDRMAAAMEKGVEIARKKMEEDAKAKAAKAGNKA